MRKGRTGDRDMREGRKGDRIMREVRGMGKGL